MTQISESVHSESPLVVVGGVVVVVVGGVLLVVVGYVVVVG